MSIDLTDGTRQRPLVLYVCHNHPSIRPGGAEAYAHELFRSVRESGDFDAVFLAKGGPPLGTSGRLHEGTVIAPVDDGPDEYFFFTDGYRFDWLLGTITDKDFYTRHLRRFLEALRPDVIHFQHTLFLGYDVLREVRNTLPHAAIVYTLHEYAPICHRDGQLLRTVDEQPCSGPTARRCHECFPEVSAQDFFLRKRYIQSHLDLVDTFVAPSRFLRDRYIEWGIAAERITYEENGRTAPVRVAGVRDRSGPTSLGPNSTGPSSAGPNGSASMNSAGPNGAGAGTGRGMPDRFGYFGQLSRFKGVDVLLDAMRLATEHDRGAPGATPAAALLAHLAGTPVRTEPARTAVPNLSIHGANLELQHGPWQERVGAMLDSLRDHVTMVGRYRPVDLPDLMEQIDWVVVPSIWFENAPLVIQEAFTHGRPVICSDIGGMAEKVTDGVDGLHFRAGDARSLAATLRRAAGDRDLWERLRSGIATVHPMEQHMENLSKLYHGLLAGSGCREVLHG